MAAPGNKCYFFSPSLAANCDCKSLPILITPSIVKSIMTKAIKKPLFLVLVTSFQIHSTCLGQEGNRSISSFHEAKKLAPKIHIEHPFTIYCPCRYSEKTVDLKSCGYQVQNNPRRAARLEWEHVVPAEAFGQSFLEWREGAPNCIKRKTGKKFKGRKCAEKNSDFALMESDLYNLWPVIGELNGLRSNYSMAQISGKARTFGACQAKILDRKFEPMDLDKGIVARVYMYMDTSYPNRGIISGKNRKLFEAWDRQFPVTERECKRAKLIEAHQHNKNAVLMKRCPKNS